MITNWIYYLLITAAFNIDAEDIFLNINMDYLPDKEILILINATSQPNCEGIKLKGKDLVLEMLPQFKCKEFSIADKTFKIFTYSASITKSIITVKNTINALENIKRISNTEKKVIILNIQENYIVFLICETNANKCPFKSIDKQKAISNTSLEMYSACNTINDPDACITDVEFSREIIRNENFIGNAINIINSTMKSKYDSTLNCHNGGIKKTKTNKEFCLCEKSDAFIEKGPQCEALQQRLNTIQYLYILPNTNTLTIEFSLSAPAHPKVTEIFRVNQASGLTIMQYTINEDQHIFRILENNVTIKCPLDRGSTWLDVFLHFQINENIIFRINENENSMTNTLSWPLMLDNLPLIVYGDQQSENVKICFSHLKINSRIVDLYSPLYTDCTEGRCKDCKDDQKCIFAPFKSTANVECICKIGTKRTNDICMADPSNSGQIQNLENRTMELKANMAFANFRFRTLSENGQLISFVSRYQNFLSICIQISNTHLYSFISNGRSHVTSIIKYHQVSDGEWHNVYIKIARYLYEITLDENLPHNSDRLWLSQDFFPTNIVNPEITVITFGPLTKNQTTNPNLTTCFDTIIIIPDDLFKNKIMIANLSDVLSPGCENGLNCSMIFCEKNQKCIEIFQNSACVCENHFTDVDGVCKRTECHPNPCENGGYCFYNPRLNTHQCNCKRFYTGYNCQIYSENAFFQWWIILIILLILVMLLIGFIIFKCHTKQRKRKYFPDINQVHENIVCYNDQAGEADYTGPEINFDLINKVPNSKEPQTMDLLERKKHIEARINGLNLDQPLEYAFEGFNSDIVSVSSLGSGSTDEELNIQPLQHIDENFNYLRNLYK